MKIIFRRADGGISITHVHPGDDYNSIKQRHVPSDAVILFEGEANIPSDRSERDCWDWDGSKIHVHPAKKAAKQVKENKKNSTLAKLGITKEELADIIKG